MSHRQQRVDDVSTFAQWVDRLMLPVVTALLVLGSVFVVSAWSVADNASSSSRKLDEARAERLASSVRIVLEQRQQDLANWVSLQRASLQPGHEDQLRAALGRQVGEEAQPSEAAWLVVRSDGSIAAASEAHPGQVAASGIADDLRTLGRTAATTGDPVVSGRLKLGDEHAYAVAVPIPGRGDAPGSALVAVTYINSSLIGPFLGARKGNDVDAAALLDDRGRAIIGTVQAHSDDLVQRTVGDSGWMVEFEREPLHALLPSWAYPAFAVLLIFAAAAFGVQERNRRRARREADQRAATVEELYELASRALQASSMEEQAEALAAAAIDLGGVDAARVTVSAADDPFERSQGTLSEDAVHERAISIIGPRGELGELAVRSTQPIDERSAWVLETATALVGAGVETRVLLQNERAVASELQRLDELRSNLLATVSHELLSPLTAVKGVLGLLSMQDDLGSRGREYVDVATERTDRLVALIRDLFDCSLLETGQLDIRPRRQRADELLEAALGAQAAARSGELRLSATPNLMITVDPVRFDQLVNNLVTNAFRHGSPPVEVAVRPGDGGVHVMVSDEGPGIPLQDRDEVFGKFWQGSGGHAREAEGAGLGLSLVQGLVRVHGGNITIDSTHADGRGARFIAFFPDVVAGMEPAPDGVETAPARA